MTETWRPVPGHEGRYEVSDQGRVRSLVFKAPRILRPAPLNRFGHLSVALGRRNSRLVHALVMAAFVGPRPPNHDIAHNNGDPADNRLTNLRYCSRAANNRDIAVHGRRKLSREMVKAIRESDQSGAFISDLLSISPSLVSAVRHKRKGYYDHF